jgi:glycosyltransferase involved in cell wall biosynthesis
MRHELALAEDESLLLAVGRLAPQKSYSILLDAVSILTKRGGATPRFKLAIAGEGPERAQLELRIRERNLPVQLLGHRSDIGDLLAAADVFVLSSRWEARALVIQEALTAGVPTVATAVGGLPELVGDAALLVPWNDPQALADAFDRVLIDAALRDTLAKAGPIQAATWPTFTEALDAARAWYVAEP